MAMKSLKKEFKILPSQKINKKQEILSFRILALIGEVICYFEFIL